jgi:hypothetical protein
MPAFVIAHYDPQGRVAAHLFALARALPGPVVFVSTGISDAEADRLSAFAEVIRRPNTGYDFLSWQAGIDRLAPTRDRAGGLVILNSSFVALHPDRLLERFLGRFDEATGLLGLTASEEFAPHLQSYLVGFGPAVVRSAPFRAWWSGLQPLPDRNHVVASYELGMSPWFAAHGHASVALFEPTAEQVARATAQLSGGPRGASGLGARRAAQAGARGVLALNPTHAFWEPLHADFGVVKLELLRANPYELDLAPLRERCTPQELALIADALR